MKTNIIYACKYKLIGIDNMVPIFLELASRFGNLNFFIIYPDRFHYTEIKKNYLIWKALNIIEAKSIIVNRSNKVFTVISLARIAFYMIFRKNIILKNSDILPRHSWFIKMIKRVSKTYEVFAYILNLTNEAYRLFEIGYNLQTREKKRNKKLNTFQYDLYISSIDRDTLKSVFDTDVESEKFLKMGYNRRLSCWTAFVERESHYLERFGEKYFVFYLTGISGNRLGLEEPDYSILLIESLKILNRYSDEIKTVFKPHIVTDMDRFKKILSDVGYKNYIIDYGHPMVLAYKAKFVFAYTYSTVLFDAYFLGKPVMLYTQYDPRLYEKLGKQSEGGRACDYFIHRDQEQLNRVVKHLVREHVTVERDSDFIVKNFPKTSPEFWKKWSEIV